jgi:hypothetical protein
MAGKGKELHRLLVKNVEERVRERDRGCVSKIKEFVISFSFHVPC